jgi:homoserine kinase type II
MAVKTAFSQGDFASILSQYDLGTYVQSAAAGHGTVQTNFIIQTTRGQFVFRYYENRSKESVLFESDVLTYLTAHRYPCPAPFENAQGGYVGIHRNKPYVVFEFIAGRHIEHPSDHHKQQLIQKAAELQMLTADFRSSYTPHRWNYNPGLCRTLAREEAAKVNTKDAQKKFAWLDDQLSALDLPPSMPKGICHCDFHFSNVLFQEGRFVALLDFDDANHTFLTFDLVGLIDSWAWSHHAVLLDLAQARSIVREYQRQRPLTSVEQEHLYDVYKLSILMDCVWYFGRGPADDFREKSKIDALTTLGRGQFHHQLFHR